MRIEKKEAIQICEEVSNLLDRFRWIDKFEAYVHLINKKKIEKSSENDKSIHFQKSKGGLALRLISTKGHFREYSFGLAYLNYFVENLSEPAPRGDLKAKIVFPTLSKPRKSGVSSLKMLELFRKELVDENFFGKVNNTAGIEFKVINETEFEAIAITNSSSNVIGYNDYRHFTQLIAKDKKQNLISFSRESFGKNIESVNKRVQDEIPVLIEKIKNVKLREFIKLENSNLPILLHPDIVNSIILSLVNNSIRDKNSNSISEILPDNYQLYSDPDLHQGFYSQPFDDEGVRCKSVDLTNQVKKIKFNKFRYRSFSSFTRSYDYSLREHYGNLVILGEEVSKQSINSQKLKYISIRKARVQVLGIENNSRFIANVIESELVSENGIKQPLTPFTISGNINYLLSKSILTREKLGYSTPHLPGSSYSGWLWVPKNILKVISHL